MTTKTKRAKRPKPLAKPARRLRASVYLLLAAIAFSMPIYAGHIYDLHTINLAETPNQNTLLLINLVDTAQSMAFLIAMATFLLWIWRAARNLSLLPDPPRPTPSPSEAVLCWFIPVLNVYTTLQVLKKLLHGSLRTRPDQWTANHTIFSFWATWILSAFIHFANYAPTTLQGTSATSVPLIESAYAALVANILAVIALVHLLSWATQITDAQDQAITEHET